MLVDWLWCYEDDDFWQRLAIYANSDWNAFAECVRQAWQAAGGQMSDLICLDHRHNCVDVWQRLSNTGKSTTSKKFCKLQSIAEFRDWLWYYQKNSFWAALRASWSEKNSCEGWKHFAALLKQEWKCAGGDVAVLTFLNKWPNCRELYGELFLGWQRRRPLPPGTLPP